MPHAAPSGDGQGQGFQQAVQHGSGFASLTHFFPFGVDFGASRADPLELSNSDLELCRCRCVPAEHFFQPARNSNKWEAPGAFAEDWCISSRVRCQDFLHNGTACQCCRVLLSRVTGPGIEWLGSVHPTADAVYQAATSLIQLVFVTGGVACLLTDLLFLQVYVNVLQALILSRSVQGISNCWSMDTTERCSLGRSDWFRRVFACSRHFKGPAEVRCPTVARRWSSVHP